MKILFLTLSFIGVSLMTSADELNIQKFDIIRSGGGSVQITLSKSDDGRVFLVANECIAKSSDQKGKFATLFLSDEYSSEALSVLNNVAVLAEDQSLTLPGLLTGTWLSLKVTYQITKENQASQQSYKVINNPLVIINGKLSSVLNSIEMISQDALSKSFERLCSPPGGGATISNGN